MEVIIVKDPAEASRMAADRIVSLVKNKPQAVLGLATGHTPIATYGLLVEAHEKNKVDFSHITTFNLDEYVGLPADHPASYSQFMQKKLFTPLGLKPEQCFIPRGVAEDIELECQAYEALILEKGPIDLQILGIGRDGHIGFNEPGSSLGSRTRLKTLTDGTRADNQQFFAKGEEVPFHVITMGIQTILETTEVVLMAFGEAKAKAVAQTVEGPITSWVPGSALQFHPKAKIIVDEAAASQLQNKAYYKEVFTKKPSWQRAEFI